ncbi:MAG TPA: phage regulatory CII family protein [Sideroxyarcus sp.]|nr:phage regulatory CII family protein [Sideroxyarcus sp.]
MGNSVPKDVQQAFREVAFDFDVEKLAAMMSISRGTLYNKCNCNENESNHNKPTLSDAVLVTLLTNDKRIIQAFSQTVGGVYFDKPDLSNLTTDALMAHILKIARENGNFHSAIDRAIEKNGICKSEYSEIEREGHELIAAILESLYRMKEMAEVSK